MNEIVQIPEEFIEKTTDFKSLIQCLKEAFRKNVTTVPMRHHHDFPNPEVGEDSTLLLMPAWNPSEDAGVKIVTVSPANGQFDLPAIQGTYIYLDATTGSIKALLEAKSLTAKRTAAASALASSFLSRKDADSLLMLGTGALSANLITAHCAVRPITKVYVWGRSLAKAQKVVDTLCLPKHIRVEAVTEYRSLVSEVAIISCATLSKLPLVFGCDLVPGQHIDLVGAYKKDMREADDEAVQKARVFVDTFQGGLKESGDIVLPLSTGVLQREEVLADLFELSGKGHQGRETTAEITLFKSVGHALEDVSAAAYYYGKYTNEK